MSKKHGLKYTRIYQTWADMKRRCYNKNDKAHYPDYGARGIVVCDEWKNDFMAFYNWAIKNGYNDTLTIERVDVNGIYEPCNCKWATKEEQNRNKRTNRKISFCGKTLCVSEWARLTGIEKNTLKERLNRGWSIEKTLTTEVVKC